MKLLTHPGSTLECITVGGTYLELRTTFNPLGIFGIGPVFKTQEIVRHRPEMHFTGRRKMIDIKVDFESEDPWRICVYHDEEFDCWRNVRRPEGWALELDGVKYTLFGLMPLTHVEGNVWECCLDHYEDSL